MRATHKGKGNKTWAEERHHHQVSEHTPFTEGREQEPQNGTRRNPGASDAPIRAGGIEHGQ